VDLDADGEYASACLSFALELLLGVFATLEGCYNHDGDSWTQSTSLVSKPFADSTALTNILIPCRLFRNYNVQ
jgi:hypothetical protein